MALAPPVEWFPIAVPALIDPGLFEQAQAQLAGNRAMLGGHPPRRVYLLRGLLRCGACGRKLEGTPSHGRRAYRCAGRDRLAAARCRAQARGAEALEAFVLDTVVAVLRDPAVLTEKLEAHRARLGAHEVEVRSEIEHLARQVAEADRQEQKLLDLFLDERLDSPAVRGWLADVRRRKVGLEERLTHARAHAATQQAEDARQDAIRRFCRLGPLRGLDQLNPEGRQRLLRALLDQIVVRGEAVELHGVLPGQWMPSNREGTVPSISRFGTVPSEPVARFVLTVSPGS